MRRWVLYGGSLAAAAGVVIVSALPFPVIPRLTLMLLWLLENLRELLNIRRGTARLHALQLDAGGTVTVIGPDDKVVEASLLGGSLVLKRLAWLRLRFPDGLRYGELFRRGTGRDAEWHRLQLIWRHRRGAFGRHGGSDTICRPISTSNNLLT